MARYLIDDSASERLPLPLAQLYKRAQNSKTPFDRHMAAYYMWEASLKLLGCVAVIEFAELKDHDEELAERLQNLARPAVGHWWEFARRLVPVLADTGDESFDEVRKLLLGRTRDDMPNAARLDSALVEHFDPDRASQARSTVRLTELYDRLVRYRNREIGHGVAGVRPGKFYEQMGEAILGGIADVLHRVDCLAGRRLLYVADVRRLGSGAWLIERFELVGDSPKRLPSLEVNESRTDRLPLSERLYVVKGLQGDDRQQLSAMRLLHPLAIYDAEGEEVFFLNGRKGSRDVEYLGYNSGEDKRQVVTAERRTLLTRVLGTSVDDSTLNRWADNSLAEEPQKENGQEASGDRKRIGEFELLSRMGQGGMGTVYRAWQPSLGRQVAVKRLMKSGDAKAQVRFGREIRSLGRVEHSHVVKIFTSGVDGDDYFYAMELIEGTDLAEVCQQLRDATVSEVGQNDWIAAISTACEQAREREESIGGTTIGGASTPTDIPSSRNSFEQIGASKVGDDSSHQFAGATVGGRSHVAQVVDIVRQAAKGTHALHETGVIHRDIKPGNIMITSDGGHAVVMDLGLAQLIDEAEGRVTRTTQFVGTLRYASPEQLLSIRLDRRSDVYSLGATLWELLTLQPLFGATDQMPAPELMLKIQSTEPTLPRRINPHVPPDLQAIVLKCLDKDRARRYATAAELADDLGRWQRNEPVHAQPPSLRYLMGKYARRYKWRIAGTAAVLSLLLAGAVFGFVQHVRNVRLDEQRQSELRQKDLRYSLELEQRAAERLISSRSFAEASFDSALTELRAGRYSTAHRLLQRAADEIKGDQMLKELRDRIVERREQARHLMDFERLMDRAMELTILEIDERAVATGAQALKTIGVFDHPDWWTQLPIGDLSPIQVDRLRDDVYLQLLVVSGLRLKAVLHEISTITGAVKLAAGGFRDRLQSSLEAARLAERFRPADSARSCREMNNFLLAKPPLKGPDLSNLKPMNAADSYMLGVCFWFLGEWVDAEGNAIDAVLDKVLPFAGDIENPRGRGLAMLSAAARTNPHSYWTHFYLGFMEASLENYEASDRAFAATASLKPSLWFAYSRRADVLTSLALKMEDTEQKNELIRQSLRNLERAQDVAPFSSDVHWDRLYRLSSIRRSGHWSVSEHDLIGTALRAMELSPPASMLTPRENYLRKYMFDEMLTYADELIKDRPDVVAHWQLRAAAQRALAKKDEALEAINKALQRDPSDPKCLLLRGLVLLENGQSEQALEDIHATLLIQSDDGRAMLAKAECLEGLEQFDSANRSFDRALELAITDWQQVAANLGKCRCSLRQGKDAEAVQAAKAALEINPVIDLKSVRAVASKNTDFLKSLRAVRDELTGVKIIRSEEPIRSPALLNGGFELGLAQHWGTGSYSQGRAIWWNFGKCNSTAVATDKVKHSGQRSLHITNKTPMADNVYGTTQQQFPTTANSRYRISLWARAKDLSPNSLQISLDREALIRPITLPPGTYEWKQFSEEFDWDETSIDLRIMSKDVGQVWLDDLRIEAVSEAKDGD